MVLDDALLYDFRMVVPEMFRKEVIEGLHAAHQGAGGMVARARDTLFWPGIYTDLEAVRARCGECNVKQPSQAALPPRPLASPDYPFQMIVADYCTIKAKTWLVLADRFTGWVTIFFFPREAKAKQLITILWEMFSTCGVWENVVTDGRSQFRAMEIFLTRLGVEHRISSDYSPLSNLRAETTKRLLMTSTKSDGSANWDKVSQALLHYWNTPIRDLSMSWHSSSLVVLAGICSR